MGGDVDSRADPKVLERRLSADDDAPREARDLVRKVCEECALDDTTSANLYLAVSELVTNAVVHGPPGDLGVRVARKNHSVRLEVSDSGTTGFDWPHEEAA